MSDHQQPARRLIRSSGWQKRKMKQARCKGPYSDPSHLSQNDTMYIFEKHMLAFRFAVFLGKKIERSGVFFASREFGVTSFRNEQLLCLLLGWWLESVKGQSNSQLHHFTCLVTVLPRRRRSTEPRRRRERHTRWESWGTEARRWTWHSWWSKWHRAPRKGRWTRCRRRVKRMQVSNDHTRSKVSKGRYVPGGIIPIPRPAGMPRPGPAGS